MRFFVIRLINIGTFAFVCKQEVFEKSGFNQPPFTVTKERHGVSMTSVLLCLSSFVLVIKSYLLTCHSGAENNWYPKMWNHVVLLLKALISEACWCSDYLQWNLVTYHCARGLSTFCNPGSSGSAEVWVNKSVWIRHPGYQRTHFLR